VIPFTKEMAVLEVGGGDKPIFRPNLDVRRLPSVDVVADLSQPWPVPDAAYDGVYSAYVLEHVSWRQVPTFIAELIRVLKPGGTAFVVTANTEAQMKWALKQGNDFDRVAQCLFGDLDYAENSHKAAFNPGYAIRLFREAGFDDVAILPHGEFGTDMVIEARKNPSVNPGTWSPEERRRAYDRRYFGGGGPVGGYAREGYWDYPVHWTTFQKVMELKPESVLEIGCARGYLVKRFQDAGIRAEGLEVSNHCLLTRACDGIKEWDLTVMPWPFKDKEFDLCISVATLEHIPQQHLPEVLSEIARVSKRSLHGVDFGAQDDGFDKTHCTLHDRAWWEGCGRMVDQNFDWGFVDKEDLEKGVPPIPRGDGKVKLNLGSFTTMYHHGWQNVDIIDLRTFAGQYGYSFVQHDLRKRFWLDDGVVDLVNCCHMLEHLTYAAGLAFLREVRRVMKHGATIRVSVPDTGRLVQMYAGGLLGKLDELNEGSAANPYQSGKLWELLVPGHLAAYDAASLSGALRKAGFSKVSEAKFRESRSDAMLRETLDMYPELSVFVEGTA